MRLTKTSKLACGFCGMRTICEWKGYKSILFWLFNEGYNSFKVLLFHIYLIFIYFISMLRKQLFAYVTSQEMKIFKLWIIYYGKSNLIFGVMCQDMYTRVRLCKLLRLYISFLYRHVRIWFKGCWEILKRIFFSLS